MTPRSSAGIFPETRKHRHFETPIEKHKRKEIAKHRQGKKTFPH
ncbi:MAG: 30S ribosomal protein S21 [Nostoc sp. LPT]|nr:30S ribosomal protein S21 [Nostoc sp. LPT]